MRFDLILMIVSILFITLGYSKQLSPKCKEEVEIKYVPMSVYDDMLLSKSYF
tara:strand:+ start:403 stop:558 length:156 start_codon:yes stop_codon:yes gene_type:complete